MILAASSTGFGRGAPAMVGRDDQLFGSRFSD
jgi:hypothetical protein